MFNLPHFYTLAVTTVANSGPVMNQCVVPPAAFVVSFQDNR